MVRVVEEESEGEKEGWVGGGEFQFPCFTARVVRLFHWVLCDSWRFIIVSK